MAEYEVLTVENQDGALALRRRSAAEVIPDVPESAAPLYGTAEAGSVASFSDGAAERKMRELIIGIEPVQAGTGDPSPTNVRPISGWTGANIAVTDTAPPFTIVLAQDGSGDPSPTNIRPLHPGLTFDLDDETTLEVYGGTLDVPSRTLTVTHERVQLTGSNVAVVGTSSANVRYAQMAGVSPNDGNGTICCNEYVPYHAAGTARRSGELGLNPNGGIYIYDNRFTDLETARNLLNAEPVVLVYAVVNPTVYELSDAETARALAALGIDGSVYSVDWEPVAGTVYGGTLNVLTGELTVDRAYMDITRFSNLVGVRDAGTLVRFDIPAAQAGIVSSADVRAISNRFTDFGNRADEWGCYVTNYGRTFIFVISDPAVTTLEEANAWLADNPTQFVYRLAEPVVHRLTPQEVTTLLGENNVYADCGPVESLVYVRDTGAVIEAMGAEVSGMIAEDAPGGVASRNYAVGEFLTADGKLYRTTAAIAVGETVTPGTNVSETTVGEQMAAIWAVINS